jgi:hypothetical protein
MVYECVHLSIRHRGPLMRHLLTLLLLPTLFTTSASAAEALSNKALDKTYMPDSTPCLPGKDQTLPKGCTEPHSPTRSLTDQALHDAEQQNIQQRLGNPNLDNPDTLPPPSQLPPPELSPRQQQLIEQIRHLPAQL